MSAVYWAVIKASKQKYNIVFIFSLTETQAAASTFYVVLENALVFTCGSISESLEKVMALYYILNLTFPTPISQVMDFLQRALLRIHSDIVRGGKHSLTAINKVIKLICKLDNVELN
jgi:preprotein translocase subunit SecB